MTGRPLVVWAVLALAGTACSSGTSDTSGVTDTSPTSSTIAATASTTTSMAESATPAEVTSTMPAPTVAITAAPINTEAPPLSAFRSAAVPEVCGFPAGQLVDGRLPIPADSDYPDGSVELGNSYAAGDLDGDGLPEVAVVFWCNGGGVSWPDELHVFRQDLSPVGLVNLISTFPDVSVWRGGYDALAYSDGLMRATATLEESAAEQSVTRQLTIGMANGQLVVAAERAPVPCPEYGETAQRGDGVPTPCESIAGVQRVLAGLGYQVADDGQFGPGTEAAVMAFQADYGLPVTGIIDPETWYTLLPPD